jgi:hypothetical protein
MTQRAKVIVCATGLLVLVVGMTLARSHREQTVGKAVDVATNSSALLGLRGKDAGLFVRQTMFEGEGQLASQLTQTQQASLRETAANIFTSYTAGNLLAVRDGLTAQRQQVPEAWDMGMDWSEAARQLEWFYNSLELVPGELGYTLSRAASTEEFWQEAQQTSRADSGNTAIGMHRSGLAILEERGQLTRVAVRAPIRYRTPSRVEVSSSMTIDLQWSSLSKSWVQVGFRLHNVPLNQPFPMIPY